MLSSKDQADNSDVLRVCAELSLGPAALSIAEDRPMLFKSSPQPRQTPSPSLQRNTSDLAARLHRSTSDLATRAMRVQEAQAVRVSPAGISEALTIVTPLDAAERRLCGSQAGQLEASKVLQYCSRAPSCGKARNPSTGALVATVVAYILTFIHHALAVFKQAQ